MHASPRAVFVAVSNCTAAAWAGTVASRAILNGVDTERWVPGPGGGPAVWSGRLVPEKAPHLAIDAARRAGMPLLLAGPVLDAAYYDREVRPRLGDDVRHVGHLDQRALCALVGSASVAVVTPEWEEPYGLVAAEAMACGTPVAALDRGAMREVVVDGGGRPRRPARPRGAGHGDPRRRPARPGAGAADRRRAVLAGADGRRLRAGLRAGPRAAAGGRVIGYYVHHHGHGHLHRALVLADACRLPVVGLSSLPRPAEWTGEWVQLARDDDDPRSRATPPPAGSCTGRPSTTTGLRSRMATHLGLDRASTGRRSGLGRLGRGGDAGPAARRTRRRRSCCPASAATRRTGPGSASPASWCPSGRPRPGAWCAGSRPPTRRGALPRRAVALRPRRAGGRAARRRRTTRRGAQRVGRRRSHRRPARPGPGGHARLGVAGARAAARDLGGRPGAELRAADVVVTHAGQNAVAEVAAARRPAVVVPKDRPYGEQRPPRGPCARGGWPVACTDVAVPGPVGRRAGRGRPPRRRAVGDVVRPGAAPATRRAHARGGAAGQCRPSWTPRRS